MQELLQTKLFAPSSRTQRVKRDALFRKLDSALTCRLTVLSAPAGFGKTSLLVDWIYQTKAAVAWLSLDSGDNDVARFLTYLMTAVETVFPGLSQSAFLLLDNPLIPPDTVLTAWINNLVSIPSPLVLVLDDYHLIHSQAIHDALTYLLDHQPEQLHIVIATRADPPLPLPRLRAAGQLCELVQSDLRFSDNETVELFQQIGLPLDANDIQALAVRTEGWIAGLQMAALAWQTSSDPKNFVRKFSGSNRFVLDYLAEEVLQQQPPDIQDFLIQTAILERICAPVCAAVTQKDEKEIYAILSYLDSANLFTFALDDQRQWYRYHQLFRDLLLLRLQSTTTVPIEILHKRACVWFQAQALLPEAIHHAFAAQDMPTAARLIENTAEDLLLRSEITTFLDWLDRLPAELTRDRPALLIDRAWAWVVTGRSITEVEMMMRDIPPEYQPVTVGPMAALRAYIALTRSDPAEAADQARSALEHLPATDRLFRGLAQLANHIAQTGKTHLEISRNILSDLVKLTRVEGNLLLAVSALTQLAQVRRRQGQLRDAQSILENAIQLSDDPQRGLLPVGGLALMGLGDLYREWNEMEKAEQLLRQGIKLAKNWRNASTLGGYLSLALLFAERGDFALASDNLSIARQVAAEYTDSTLDDWLVEFNAQRIRLMDGDFSTVHTWLQQIGLIDLFPSQLEQMDYVTRMMRQYEGSIYARLLLEYKQPAQALAWIEPLMQDVERQGRISRMLECLLLQARAFQQLGQMDQSFTKIERALKLAEPGGFIRMFLDEGAPITDLLHAARHRGICPEYTARLLRLGGVDFLTPEQILPCAEPGFEPLSERELDVLYLLDTPFSIEEIAARLVVAPSTVQSHIKSIYRKLDVHKRWEAVQKVRELGIHFDK